MDFKPDTVVACPAMKNNKNVSMMVRSASCFGISKIILTGQNKVNTHISRECDIQVEYKNSLMPVIKSYKAKGYRIVAIEQSKKSVSLYDYDFPLDPVPVLFTMGNECRGTDQEVLDIADDIIEIPMFGKPRSLNVAMGLTVALNEFKRQQEENYPRIMPEPIWLQIRHIKDCQRHIKDCQLGDNWKDCPVCVLDFNETCSPSETMQVPVVH